MASNMIVSLTVEQLEALVKTAVAEVLSGGNVKAVLPTSSNAKPGKKEKKAKKERDPDAPKKEANNWIKFTSRVREVLKTEGFSTGVEVTQFCRTLKEALPTHEVENASGKTVTEPDYSAISDEDILVQRRSWVKPEHSEQELAGKSKRKGSVSGSEASDSSSEAGDKPKEEKKKREWSAEAKASAAAKRAATKAAKTAAAPSDDEEEKPVTAAAPAPKKVAPPPLPVASQEEEEEDEEVDDEDFAPWVHQKKVYHKNGKNWVITDDMKWVGIYDPKTNTLNKKAPKPEELDLE